MEDLTGMQLGSYRITAPLGEGGMAAVYKAYQPGMDRYVALKVLPRHLAQEPDFLGRFHQEARLVARLQHPHILPAYDFGDDNGYTYIVMPLVAGGTLDDQLIGQPLQLAHVSRKIGQLAGALDYAHAKGIIHRDVKPSNVLLDESDNCLLTDFGIAKLVATTKHFTRTGGFIGTPAYMSPEQGLGQKLTHRSDIYSLGIILYEMVTGRVPYTAETPIATVMKHIHDPLPSPLLANTTLPAGIERVIHKALAKEPHDRFATAGDMAAALDLAISDQYIAPTFVERPVAAAPAKQGSSRYRWIALGAVIIVLLLICGGAAIAATRYFTEGWRNSTVIMPIVEEPTPTAAQTSVVTSTAVLAATNTLAPRPTQEATQIPALEPSEEPTLEPTVTLTPDIPPATIVDAMGHAMVLVPAGQSTMGTSADQGYRECQALIFNETCELSWFEDEQPVHTVNLDAFYIDQFEITNDQFARFLNEFGNQSEAGASWLDIDDDDVHIRQIGGTWTPDPGLGSHPVVEVNWYGAGAYCRWRGGRLPTEAEWEKAARGIDTRLYPWGNSYDESKANMCDTNCDLEWANPFVNDGYGTTAPVGSYPSGVSLYGAYDMSGNVFEWTLDWYAADSYTGSTADNPRGATSGEFRVTRGGSWVRNGRSIRVSYRYSFAPADATGDVGFRCIIELDE